MLKKLLFNCLSESNQIDTLRNKGKVLRTYIKNGRKGYLYLLGNFYVEVVFRNDNTELSPEKVTTFQDKEELSRYLKE